MRSILRLKRVYAEKYGFIRGYKAGWVKSGIALLPDLRFDVLRTRRGTLGCRPNPLEEHSFSDAFLRFALAIRLICV